MPAAPHTVQAPRIVPSFFTRWAGIATRYPLHAEPRSAQPERREAEALKPTLIGADRLSMSHVQPSLEILPRQQDPRRRDQVARLRRLLHEDPRLAAVLAEPALMQALFPRARTAGI